MRENIVIYDYERLDDLHRNNYKIIQRPNHFCFGIDAVLLSSFCKVKEDDNCLDLGTGTGIIPILLEAKSKGKKFFGIDIQKESVYMAKRSVLFNNLQTKIEILEGDIRNLSGLFNSNSFDVITSNPPYMNDGGGIKNNFSPKAIARHEILCSLEDVCKTASSLLKQGGKFYMIHKPFRLIDIVCNLRKFNLEPKVIQFVHPYLKKEPTMVLIEAIKGAKSMVKVLEPLVVYTDDGKYTDDIFRIYNE